MLSLLGSQLAVNAAATLAKKSFEFGIVQSLKGVSDVIRERFSNNRALLALQAELEIKVKMLCLPVDILAHYATQGNTALQEPLGVVLEVLEEVEAFRQALVQTDVVRAQLDAAAGAASPDAAASPAEVSRRLRDLIARLDSVLPYLNLAISTVALLRQGSASPVSASRLMAASWHLRSHPQPGAAVFSLPQASWHEERQLTAAGPACMSEALRLCSLAVCRQPAPAPGLSAAGSRSSDAGGWGWAYELLLQQDLEDGLYHEPGESPQTLRLQVSDIVALEWETTQSLQQGENEYRPALVLHVYCSGGGGLGAAQPAVAGDDTASKQPPGTPPSTGARAGSSRASARRPPAGKAREPAAAGSAAAAADGAGVLSPVVGTPQGPPGPRAGSCGGVGGSIRRCAVMCNLQHSRDEDDAEEGFLPSGSNSSSDDSAGSRAGDASEDTSSSDGEGEPPAAAAAAAAGAAGVAAQAGAAGSSSGGVGGLQREWELLGALEYVLRLCILEGREQAAHQEVTDERILMAFQATSVPPAAAPGAQQHTAGRAGSTLRQPRRSSTARWRGAAAGGAPPLSAGVDALTAGVRQLSFTPGDGSAAAAVGAPITTATAGEGGGSTASKRRGRRPGGRGFGSPVQ